MLGSFPDVDPIGSLVPEDVPFGAGSQTPQLASLSAGPVVLGFDFEQRPGYRLAVVGVYPVE
jgi:hypothetical protein